MSNLGITAGVTLKSVVEVTDTRNGSSTVYTYEGSETACKAQRTLERLAGATHIQLRPRGDSFWELDSTYPYDAETGVLAEQPTDTHELEAEVAQVDVFSSLKLLAQFGGGTINDQSYAIMGEISRAVRNFTAGDDRDSAEEKLTNEVAIILGASSAVYEDAAVAVFREVAYRGQTSFVEYRSIYRRTITAASPLQVQASFVGYGKIWTTLELRNYEVLPNDWWFNLDDLGAVQWLKSQPVVTTVAGQKTQIGYNYTSARKWWAGTYEPHGTAQLLDGDVFKLMPIVTL